MKEEMRVYMYRRLNQINGLVETSITIYEYSLLYKG